MQIGLARTGRRCAYCRDEECIETVLRPWKPGPLWILLCDGCVPRYQMSLWRRVYSRVVRWWKMRKLPTPPKTKETRNGHVTTHTARSPDSRPN
jgi:hypothetical protein